MRADFAFMQMMVIYIFNIDLGSVIFQSVFVFDTQAQLLEWGVMAIEHDGTILDSFNKLTYNSYCVNVQEAWNKVSQYSPSVWLYVCEITGLC